MKRFTLKYLLLFVAAISIALWFCFIKTECTVSLPNHNSAAFPKGAMISIIHKTKGAQHPVFYVKNQQILNLNSIGSTCDFTLRATNLTQLNLWMQGYENLIALPGTHD